MKNTSWNWTQVSKRDEWLEPANEVLALLFRWEQGKCVLDLGAGLGRHALLFAKHKMQVSACDLASSSIDSIIKLAASNNVNIATKQCDMKDIARVYPPNSFDYLLAYRVINHTDTKGFLDIIQQIIILLKPQGEAYIVVDAFDNFLLTSPHYQFIEPLSAYRIGGLEDGVIHHFTTPEEIKMIPGIKIISLKLIKDYQDENSDFNPYKLHVLIQKKV